MTNNFFKEFDKSLDKYISFFESDKGKEIFSSRNYSNQSLRFVCLYDSFDNTGIKRLLRNIHHLDKKKFSKDRMYFKYSRKAQYLIFQNMSSSHGLFADITTKDNEYISGINMTWCQRSNYNAMVEFQLNLKQPFKSFNQERDFIVSTLRNVNRKIINRYNRFDFEDNGLNNRTIDYIEHHDSLLKLAFQKYVENTLYKNIDKKYESMALYVYHVKSLDKEKIQPPYMGLLGKSKHANTVFLLDRTFSEYTPIQDIQLYTSERYFDHRSIMTFFSQYRNILYYNLYFYYELNILNYKISGYSVEAKKIYNFGNLLWLYRKIAELESSRDSGNSVNIDELNKKLKDNWTVEYGTYEGDNPTSLPFEYTFVKESLEIILNKYKEQYELYKVALDIQNNKLNTTIALVSLVLSIVAIIFSIFKG
jgi:hypothetical protein